MQLAGLTADLLTEHSWSFGEQGKVPWAEGFRFLADGAIGGYDNAHERSWNIEDGVLQILSDAGAVTWKFSPVTGDDGALSLVGIFVLDDSFQGLGLLQAAAPAVVKSRAVVDGKIGVLVVGANAPLIIDRVAGKFDAARFRFFLHLDAKRDLGAYTAGMKNAGKITFIEERVKVFWGGFTMVEAELALIRAALLDSEISRFVMISDDTAPLVSPEAIYQALGEAPDRIASVPNGWKEGWYRSFFFPDANFSSIRGDLMFEDRQVGAEDFAMLQRLEALRARGKKPIPAMYFCRQWWALSRASLEAMISYIDSDEHFVESFRFSLFPDEIFFPTVFMTCFPGRETPSMPTYADIVEVRVPNPWVYHGAQEIRGVGLGEEYLFIRKIQPDRPDIIDDLAAGWPVAAVEAAREAVRLVIWDLDETFWRGTLTEGGMSYVQEHHDIVIELAKRGIMSSICSKNDIAPVQRILEEKGLWAYFIFPSINWEAKGPRIAALVEAVQLRPATILFIDDNALNRNEVLHFTPDLQVADETVIPGLLASPLLQGKNDAGLSRLAQYKLLETRHVEQAASGDNVAFLRASNIKVRIEHDLEPHLDRVIELINRTNQLNFTKQRLSEDPVKAKADLQWLLNQYVIQAGLVHVQDRYGDYGFVGVYVIRSFESETSLVHFCFSCRTLGMGVESWLYERLGHPDLHVVGEVLTDLFAPRAPIDWINSDGTAGSDAQERLAGRILVRGGCAMSSTAHYLALNADEVVGEFNLVHDGKRARLDHSVFLRHAFEGLPEPAMQAAERLGYMPSDFTSALVDDPAGFDVCVFSFINDARYALYKHPASGLRVPFFEFYPDPAIDLIRFDLGILPDFLNDPEINDVVARLRSEAYVYETPSTAAFRENLSLVLSHIPETVILVFLLDPETFNDAEGRLQHMNHYRDFNNVVRELVAGRANVHLLEALDFVERPEERVNHDHFNRMVYFRVYQKIAAILRETKGAKVAELVVAAE